MTQLSRFEFTLGAGERVDLPVSGSAVTCTGGAYPFLVTTNKGSRVALERGLGLPLLPFETLGVENTAAYAQTIELYIGDETVRDSRLSVPSDTVVGIVDGSKQRVITNESFTSYSTINGLAANYNHNQIYNASTDKNLIVTAVRVSASAASSFTISAYGAPISGVYGSGVGRSKLLDAAVDTESQARVQQAASLLITGAINFNFSVPASETKSIIEEGRGDTFVIPPAKGLLVQCTTPNCATAFSVDYYKELA